MALKVQPTPTVPGESRFEWLKTRKNTAVCGLAACAGAVTATLIGSRLDWLCNRAISNFFGIPVISIGVALAGSIAAARITSRVLNREPQRPVEPVPTLSSRNVRPIPKKS